MDLRPINDNENPPIGAGSVSDLIWFFNGAPQPIVHFSRDEFPLSVVLLFDLTDSVRGVLKRLAEGAESALEHFKAADEVAVMVYSGHASVVDEFTKDRVRTLRAIETAATMTSDQPAYFNEAIYQAAVEPRQAGNPLSRVIVWLTDNLPSASSWRRPALCARKNGSSSHGRAITASKRFCYHRASCL